MRMGAIFGNSFLDGFTMAGFLGGLRRPGESTRLLEPPPVELGPKSPSIFEIGAGSDAQVTLAGDLHRVPEAALHEMLKLLESETQSRRTKLAKSAQTAHGTS